MLVKVAPGVSLRHLSWCRDDIQYDGMPTQGVMTWAAMILTKVVLMWWFQHQKGIITRFYTCVSKWILRNLPWRSALCIVSQCFSTTKKHSIIGRNNASVSIKWSPRYNPIIWSHRDLILLEYCLARKKGPLILLNSWDAGPYYRRDLCGNYKKNSTQPHTPFLISVTYFWKNCNIIHLLIFDRCLYSLIAVLYLIWLCHMWNGSTTSAGYVYKLVNVEYFRCRNSVLSSWWIISTAYLNTYRDGGKCTYIFCFLKITLHINICCNSNAFSWYLPMYTLGPLLLT